MRRFGIIFIPLAPRIAAYRRFASIMKSCHSLSMSSVMVISDITTPRKHWYSGRSFTMLQSLG